MISPKSRPLRVGTSWKMNKTLGEAESFIEILRLRAPLAAAGAGHSTIDSRILPWTATAALL
jgi:hypothetical protein